MGLADLSMATRTNTKYSRMHRVLTITAAATTTTRLFCWNLAAGFSLSLVCPISCCCCNIFWQGVVVGTCFALGVFRPDQFYINMVECFSSTKVKNSEDGKSLIHKVAFGVCDLLSKCC